MQTDYIDLIEPTPTLHSKKCKIIAYIINLFLQFATVTSAVVAFFLYDYFVAIATLLVIFIVMGIVRSKLRNDVIPVTQREHQYSDKEIAIWYTARELCNDNLEIKLESIDS